MKFHPVIAVCALLLVLGVPDAALPQEAQGEEYARAEALIDAGQTAEAAVLIEQALAAMPADDPRLADWHFLLGIARFRDGDDAGAEQAFLRALALDPAHVRVRYNLGAVHFRQERWDQAAEQFAAVAAQSPELAQAGYLNAGIARMKQGRMRAARKLLRRAIREDPSSASAEKARGMLVLAGGKPAPSKARAAAAGTPFGLRLDLGREFDSNVFASPDDQTVSDATDWRTTGRGRLSYTKTVAGGVRLTSRYDFFGRWYNSENRYNYISHQGILRLDRTGARLRPRYEYRYGFNVLGGKAYLATHTLWLEVTLHRRGDRRVRLGGGVEWADAPGTRYDYLSGRGARLSLSMVDGSVADGQWYGSFGLRYVDRDDRTAGAEFFSYSYTAVEPRLQWSKRFPGRIRLTAGGYYQFRQYHDADVWATPVAGSKTRRDHRLTGIVRVGRPVYRNVSAEFSWQGQLTRSNIGNSPNDYRDRDYTRHVTGVWLRADW